MTLYKFTVTFQDAGGLPENQIVNTWHFWDEPGFVTDFDNVRDMLDDFYCTQPFGGTGSIVSFMSPGLAATVLVKAYNPSDPIPRTPVYESSFTRPNTSTGDPLPREVALVCSFQLPPISGTPQARRRNRVYLGPFGETANGTDGRPVLALRTNIARAARDLIDASNASLNWDWYVWSDTYQEGGPVQEGWVDDAWDTQRRRGLPATARTQFSDSLP
jgi:hypothetical protein